MEETKDRSVGEKLWKYAEGPWFWGGVALIIGAAAANINLAIIFAIGYVPISVGVIRSKLFDGCTTMLKIRGNGGAMLLAALLLFGVWKLIPQPQRPLTIGDLRSLMQSIPASTPASTTSNSDSQVATKDDIRTLLQRFGQLQNKTSAATQQEPALTDAGKTSPIQTPAPTQTPIPVEAQLQPLKTVALTLADEINKWADQRLKEAPESFPPSQTSEEQKKAAAFHDQIVSEWHDRYGRIAGVTLNQLYLVWRDVLKIPVPSVHACMLDNIGIAQGDRGILETKKRCANFIKEAAERIN